MDGVLALGLWDNDQVPRSTHNNVRPKHTSIQETGALLHSETKRRQEVEQLLNVEYVHHPPPYMFLTMDLR